MGDATGHIGADLEASWREAVTLHGLASALCSPIFRQGLRLWQWIRVVAVPVAVVGAFPAFRKSRTGRVRRRDGRFRAASCRGNNPDVGVIGFRFAHGSWPGLESAVFMSIRARVS